MRIRNRCCLRLNTYGKKTEMSSVSLEEYWWFYSVYNYSLTICKLLENASSVGGIMGMGANLT